MHLFLLQLFSFHFFAPPLLLRIAGDAHLLFFLVFKVLRFQSWRMPIYTNFIAFGPALPLLKLINLKMQHGGSFWFWSHVLIGEWLRWP